MDSPSPDVVLERSFFWGAFFKAMLYGIDVFMFFYSTQLSWSPEPSTRRKQRAYVIIGGVLLALLSVSMFTDIVFLEFMWIDHRNAPGGPLGFLGANSAVWWETFGTATTQVANFIGDGLLMYRCYLIWNSGLIVVAFPIILYLGSIAMAMMTLVQSAVPGSNFFRGQTVNYGVPWAVLSVALNVTLTVLITVRILHARTVIQRLDSDKALPMGIYTGISAILIESSLPFSVLGIIFAVTYGKNLDIGPSFLFIWATFTVLSPQFIIFRVASGRAWTHDVASDLSSADSAIAFHEQRNTQGSMQLSTVVASKFSKENSDLDLSHGKESV